MLRGTLDARPRRVNLPIGDTDNRGTNGQINLYVDMAKRLIE